MWIVRFLLYLVRVVFEAVVLGVVLALAVWAAFKYLGIEF